MLKYSVTVLLALAALTPVLAQSKKAYDLIKVADGVYSVIPTVTLAAPAEGNSTIIINDVDVIVVDSNQTLAAARATIGEIRKLTDKPVRFVINSHWHDDHIFGNQVYQEIFPQVEFIAHKNTREDFLSQGGMKSVKTDQETIPNLIKNIEAVLAGGKKSNGQPLTDQDKDFLNGQLKGLQDWLPEFPLIKPVAPTITLEKELTLYRGDHEIRIIYPGRGNTRGDIAVFLPKEKVLMTGDLLVSPVPFSFGSYLSEWIVSLKKLRELPTDTIIPGHGQIEISKDYIDQVTGMLDYVVQQTGQAVKRGLSLEETRKVVNLDEYKARFTGDDRYLKQAFDQFFTTPAVERAYLEAKGELDKK